MKALRNVVLALAILFVLTAVAMAAGEGPTAECWLFPKDTGLPPGCELFTTNWRWRVKPSGDATLTCRFDNLESYMGGLCVPDETIRSAGEVATQCVYEGYNTTLSKWVVSKNGKASLTCRFELPD
jgi:hypothetical protein